MQLIVCQEITELSTSNYLHNCNMRELFQLLKTRDLTPNGYYLLYCLESNQKVELPLSEATELKRLQLMGLIDYKLKVTDVGLTLLAEVDALYSKDKKKSKFSLSEEFIENIQAYRDLFPTSKVAGKLVRNNLSDLEQRMTWFMRTYPSYDWQIILNATKKYLESFNGDYKYCMTSAYFIKKDDKSKASLSLLSSWCEAELESDGVEEQPPAVLGFNRLV